MLENFALSLFFAAIMCRPNRIFTYPKNYMRDVLIVGTIIFISTQFGD